MSVNLDLRRIADEAVPFPPRLHGYTRPRNGVVQQVISLFMKSNHSTHSASRRMLPYIIQYCEENAIPYRLTAIPTQGYYIERLNPDGSTRRPLPPAPPSSTEGG